MRAPSDRRSGGHLSGTFPSEKLGRPVHFRTTVERDYLYYLEHDPDVVTYQERPFPVADPAQSMSVRQYTPTFLVVRRMGPELVECAAKEPVAGTRQPHDISRAWAAANHHRFTIVTGTTLRAGHRLANLQLLWRFRQHRLPPLWTTRCLAVLSEHPGGLPLADLAARLRPDTVGERPSVEAYLYHLLWRRVLVADLDRPLTPDSILGPAHAHI